MAECECFIVDAFTDRAFGGNPAVIVPEADGLTERAMQALAAELRMEAGFILKPTSGEADLRMRFFSPGAEVDVSGHVTVAAYAALLSAGKLPGEGPTRHIRQESRAGIMSVDLALDGDAGPWVTLDLGRPEFGAAIERAEVTEAFRVGAGALASGPAPRIVTAGVSLGVVQMTDAAALAATLPDMAKLAGLSRRRGVLGFIAFASPGLHPQTALTARFFFPAVGPDEDPVSGAALAAAVAYAVRERILPCVGEATFQTDQGHSLGRPSRAHVKVTTDAGHIASLSVRGRGAVVMRGKFVVVP